MPGEINKSELASFRSFARICEQERDKLPKEPGETPVHIDAEGVERHKVKPEAGKEQNRSFMLSYRDARKDFTCVDQVQWSPTHEHRIRVKNPGEDSFHSVSSALIPDACAMVEKFVGADEFAGQTCQDDFVDPRLKNSWKQDGRLFDSAKQFATKCRERLEKYGRDNPDNKIPNIDQYLRSELGDDFVLRFTKIVDPLPRRHYGLLFQTYSHNFFCAGEVDWDKHPHNMLLASGPIAESQKDGPPEMAEPDDEIEMPDACSVTRAWLGEKASPYNCQDRTAGERNLTTGIRNGFQAVSGAWLLYKEHQNKTIAKLVASPRTPVVARTLGNAVLGGMFGYGFFEEVTGLLGLSEDHPVRNFGKWLAAVAGGAISVFVPKISAIQGLVGYLAFDTAAGALGLSEDHPVRKHGKWFAGAAGVAAPPILARTGLAAPLAASTLGVWLSRANLALALMGGVDYLSQWMKGDYETSLDARATEMIYEDNGFNQLGDPRFWLNSPMGALRVFFPNTINSYTANCPDIHDGKFLWESHQKKQLRKEDQAKAADALQALQITMPQLLHPDNEYNMWGDLSEETKTSLALLQKKVWLTPLEQVQVQMIISDPAKEIEKQLERAKQSNLSDQEYNDLFLKLSAQQAATVRERAEWFLPNPKPQELDNFLNNLFNKFYTQKAQEAAATLVFVPGAWSPVVDELFHKDGTLKNDMDDEGKFTIAKARDFFRKDAWNQ